MKTKLYTSMSVVVLVVIITIFWIQSCEKSVQDIKYITESKQNLICNLYDNISGKPLQNCNITLVSPQGTQDYISKNETFVIDNITEGTYIVKVWKDNFVSVTKQVKVLPKECESCGSVYVLYFYLTKMSNPIKIGAQGGDINFPDGTVLHFPVGALNDDINIIATQIPTNLHPNQMDFTRGRLPVMEINIQPEGLVFNKQLTLSIPKIYLKSTTDSDIPLSIGRYDIETSNWVGMKKGKLNEAKTFITFQVDHFSTLSLFPGFRLVNSSWVWTDFKDLAISACGEEVSATFTESLTLTAEYFVGGSFTASISATGNCSAMENYERTIRARCHWQSYDVEDSNFFHSWRYLTTISFPDTPIDFDCVDSACHEGGEGI